MKRLFLFSLIFVICFMTAACTSKPTVELVHASAEIFTEKSIQRGIMDGNKVIKYVFPTVLSYKFLVKNTGNQQLGDKKNPVRFKLEPSDELISALRKTVGSSALDFERMDGGYKVDGEILSNATAEYSVFYELGTEEDLGSYQQIPLLPPKEQMNELQNKKFDAVLILTVGEEEIARFDLRTYAKGLPQEVQQKMEQELGINMVVPVLDRYQVKFAEVLYPPIVNNEVIGDRRVATIVYTDQKGPLIELTNEQREHLEKQQRRKLYYGEYEGKPLIRMEISNEKNSIANAKVQQIEGVAVEYSFKEVESGKYSFYSFHVDKGSYFITFQINDSFTEKDAVDFIRRILNSQK
ncbi:hypothetical protein J31TS6_06440 [Brevibacillus reuszeri]|uniref:hypothetical protein n=1 Tax=Brevibacillus reuszeri TaxID=54915 RepID=UPI001B134283|nr:hypothetical protein [Brevibacillus reuszeri]GIO04616.1 hypothetical protein J31TS6_06440 [Brevibacillus reuszeri]